MALDKKIDNGCTGQELLDTINAVIDNANDIEDEHKDRLNSLETDGFHVGDIRYSHRAGLGDNYLLCNGGEIFGSEGYSDLINVMNNSGYLWYSHTTSDSDLIVAQNAAWFSYENYIYKIVLADGHICITRYNSYKDLMNHDGLCSGNFYVGNYDYGKDSYISVYKFKDKLFVKIRRTKRDSSSNLGYYCRIFKTDISNLLDDSWFVSPSFDYWNGESASDSYDIGVVCNDNTLLIMALGGVSGNAVTLTCYITTDGEMFESKTSRLGMDGIIRPYIFRVETSVLGEYFFFRFANENNPVFRSMINTTQMFDDWLTCTDFTGSSLLFYDNYYWRISDAGIQRASSIFGTYEDIAYNSGYKTHAKIRLIVRDSQLYAISCKSSGGKNVGDICVYNNNNNSFDVISEEHAKEQGLIKEYGAVNPNTDLGTTEFETDEAYFVLSTTNVDYISVIFKNDSYSLVPNIAYDTNVGYTYIKAKE